MRSFIGSPVDNTDDFLNLIKSLSAFNEIKTVPLRNLHLTYLFLSEVTENQKNMAIKKLRMLEFKVINCRIDSIRNLPEGSRPRVVVISLDCPEILALNAMVQNSFSSDFKTNQRFLPHVTVGRYGKNNNPIKVDSVDLDVGNITFKSICIYRSILLPNGPVYEKLYYKQFT